jgi:hypothetical protein
VLGRQDKTNTGSLQLAYPQIVIPNIVILDFGAGIVDALKGVISIKLLQGVSAVNYRVIALGFVMFFYGAHAMAQVRRDDDRTIRETQVSYVVKHKNGASERVVVKYEGKVAARVWQTGSASTFPKHPVDDRQCHATISPRVLREAYLVSISGVQAVVDKYQAVYKVTIQTARGPTDIIQAAGGYHVTCGDVNLFQSNVDSADAELISQFDTLVAKDDDKARERLRTMLQGESIEAEKK